MTGEVILKKKGNEKQFNNGGDVQTMLKYSGYEPRTTRRLGRDNILKGDNGEKVY